MILIDAEHVLRAVFRWEDFTSVQVHPPSDEFLHDLHAQLAEGESVEAMVLERATANGERIADALRNLKLALGMTSEAQFAFWSEIPDLLEGMENLDRDDALEQAAMIGLVIGLTAQQLAAEETEGEPRQ